MRVELNLRAFDVSAGLLMVIVLAALSPEQRTGAVILGSVALVLRCIRQGYTWLLEALNA